MGGRGRSGTAQWEAWAGEAFVDGPNVVAGGLVPVLASRAMDVGVYAEPNVWVEHILDVPLRNGF
ncbi:hypothetical protein ACQPZF_15675 [Actinosynnema sp. CS-041913]|uniref:hypothetical protein n=1 Tax=Actinosynnema sp. CS-041913 TaxID=3239917 RepID=UPI003D8BB526